MTEPFNILFSPGDFYDELKTKGKEQVRVTQWAEFFYTTLFEMFEYKNLPPTLPKRFLESILIRTGHVFIWKDGDDLICSTGTLGGDIDSYGMGTLAIATSMNGVHKEGKRDEDIVYGFNNDLQSPETFIIWLIHICNENDLSLDLNVIYSRYLPAPLVRDEKTKRAFEEYIKKLSQGEMSAVLSDNVLNNEIGIAENVLEITDVNRSDKIQYLSRLRDDILKTFYNRYGQALQTQNKSAQQTTDEIHGMDSASFIIPLNMLKCRREMVEKINAVFGTDISVDFSEAWKIEYERYKKDQEETTEEMAETSQNEIEIDETRQEEVETDKNESEGKQPETVVESVNNSVENTEDDTISDTEAVEEIKKIIDLTDEERGEDDD